MPTSSGDLLAALGRPEVLGALAVLLLLLALLVRSLRGDARAPDRGRRGPYAPYAPSTPSAGEVWFAEVPFADGTGSKDRPVLVLHVGHGTCEVARFTSQDRSARRDHAAVPPGFPGLSRASWIDLRPRVLPTSALRRRAGVPGPALVAWYRQAADARGTSGGAA